MALTFYPHEDDIERAAGVAIAEKLDVLLEAAERYKAIIIDAANTPSILTNKRTTPADIKTSFNWDAIAQVLREIREMPEANPHDKRSKADRLLKLSEIYETLRSAKMPKLEAVRLALLNESNQVRGGAQQVA